ncbi:copper amine oxidase N-terminal domain-containing protein [Paenibacillus aquistagni]|uniref:copper amine oxidase N-terminal domain-containing protein n=1 Tax=Paenibacillus aquistagni TaxID=1852522 RepID=UPI000B50F490|nr:copper amine oxidase N-terminal domain-containing protein [Paenibacillus aquistagni]NMM55430.1 copper amine oxidase N-terminal domain-containing protein [Paenibacillus aquistagni]
MRIWIPRMILSLSVCVIFSVMVGPIAVYADFPLRVVVNGKKIEFPDAKPYVDKNSRVMVPVRFVSEALGAKVDWDAKASKVTVKQDEKTIVLFIGKKEIDVNGKKDQMDTVAVTSKQRTFVPLRFVSQALGAAVVWDSPVRTAYINTNGEAAPKAETEVVGGFVVPMWKSHTDLIVTEVEWYSPGEVMFQVNLLRADVDKQIEDLTIILSQKCDSNTVEKLVNYIKQKDERWGYLASKAFYDERSKRYLYVFETEYEGIDILFLSAEKSKEWKKNRGD